jgi:hypothetical protein
MKPTHWFAKLLRFAGVILVALVPAVAAAQNEVPADSGPSISPLLTRCATVSMTSKSGWLSPGILADKLRDRDEFRNAGLKLVAPDESADIQLTITDEVDERVGFRSASAGGDHDAYIRAVRTRDGRAASGSVPALGSYEGMVAGAVIDTLHQLCLAVMRTDRVRGSVLQTPDPAVADELRHGHSLAIDSFTYLDDESFSRRLAARSEVKAWGLAVSPKLADADLRLEIRRLRNSSTWQCQLFDRSHRLLWMHSAGALTEEHAIAGIIDGLIDQIARYRETTARARAASAHPSRIRQGVWPARLITGDFRTTLQPMEVTVDGEHFIARDVLGRQAFTIGADELEDVDHSTVRDAVFQLPPPTYLMNRLADESDAERTSDPRVVAAIIATIGATIGAYCVSAGALTAALLPFRARQHFIEIAWKDGDVERTAMFQLSGRDAGRLLDATRGLIESGKDRVVAVSGQSR